MNWNSTEFVWLDWAILAIGVIGVIWAVWHAIMKDRKAQKGEDSLPTSSVRVSHGM